MHAYDREFFDVADRSASHSADSVLSKLIEVIPITSVLDLGCGQGAWLARWLAHGTPTVLGVDGPYVDLRRLQIPPDAFLARDLSQPVSLDRQFDLVQSLEVAEHLPESAADIFVESLVRHGRLVLFSAAFPGQGGEYHVNEQPWEYWRKKFAHRGYEVFDYIRPLIVQDRDVFFWYRHNVFLYAHSSVAGALPGKILATRVPPGKSLDNRLSSVVRARASIIRRLPVPIVTRLAQLKSRASNFKAKLKTSPSPRQ